MKVVFLRCQTEGLLNKKYNSNVHLIFIDGVGSFVEAPLKMKGKMASGSPVRNNFVTAAHS